MEIKSRFMPTLGYLDAEKSIEWLENAFGFEKKAVYKTEDGKIAHAELAYKGNMIMLGASDSGSPFSKLIRHPKDTDGFETRSTYVLIDEADIDAHYERAKKQGAQIVIDLTEQDYGGKDYSCYDLEGHLWSFGSYDPWSA